MKKEKYYVYEKAPFLFWIPFCLVVASIMIILINNNITPANITLQKVFLVTYFTIAYTTSMASLCLTSAFVFCLVDEYRKNKIHNRNLQKLKNLSSEYKKVLLKNRKNYDSTNPNSDPIQCLARIDENGKIIFEIKARYEITEENCDDFFKYFEISENH